MDWDNFFVWLFILIGVGMVLGSIVGGHHISDKKKYDNFQKTIKDLNDEQKCLHICGFEWHGYYESYKFCVEKCDRISERTLNKCG